MRDYWISIFIPYTKNLSTHYSYLSNRNTQNPAKVMGYTKSKLALDEARQITASGSASISINPEIDDDENLASKVDGVDAWLQHEIAITNSRRRISIYGADLDICLANEKGILSDGMGYLFLRTDFEIGNNGEIGNFFLQL
ncbi:hypothetical protein [Pseudomonas sp. URMO17WK12:I11]|uniref:hypothetical protein n=1 Tax=Pseudomonas sp. URMO17WK12:I11 TaxID=1283291 RepID=UPI00119FF881|nr:hypothetical protein [Pseudomonas sp. URMO17WK12:I11]